MYSIIKYIRYIQKNLLENAYRKGYLTLTAEQIWHYYIYILYIEYYIYIINIYMYIYMCICSTITSLSYLPQGSEAKNFWIIHAKHLWKFSHVYISFSAYHTLPPSLSLSPPPCYLMMLRMFLNFCQSIWVQRQRNQFNWDKYLMQSSKKTFNPNATSNHSPIRSPTATAHAWNVTRSRRGKTKA